MNQLNSSTQLRHAPLLLQVEVIGTNYTFPSSEQMQVVLPLNQLSVNFTKGERVTLRAFAVNSVGTSDPVSANVIVPCELLYMTCMAHHMLNVVHFSGGQCVCG